MIQNSAPHLSFSRLCISAVSGGGGKTLLALGLAGALRRRHCTVVPFKKGPDYIDAAWLAHAAGRPASNLDPFFLSPEGLRLLFMQRLQQAEAKEGSSVLALIEGNRGLFDGLDIEGSCSTASLARVLACPILLSLNCTKMTRTAAAVIAGLTSFEPGLHFAGVVLGQIASVRHESVIRRAIETYTDIPVLGSLPRLSANPLPERHMGIASQAGGDNLAPEAEESLARLADLVQEHVSLDRVLEQAEQAPPLEVAQPVLQHVPVAASPSGRPRIGYVKDAALWFYYEENLAALEQAGAQLQRVSLLDSTPWPELDALYLGGGFPEDFLEELSQSVHVASLQRRAAQGFPIFAECGGFMVLAQAVEKNGMRWPMAGVFPVVVQFCPKPQGLGYIQGKVTADNPYFPQGMEVRGHEFHYSRCLEISSSSSSSSSSSLALGLQRGKGMAPLFPRQDAFLYKNVWASYSHFFAPAVPCWARNFVALAAQTDHIKTA